MGLPSRMKKTGKIVVLTLTMRKSWVSCKVITSMEPMRSLRSRGNQVNQTPKRDRGRVVHAVSPFGRAWETDVAAEETGRK